MNMGTGHSVQFEGRACQGITVPLLPYLPVLVWSNDRRGISDARYAVLPGSGRRSLTKSFQYTSTCSSHQVPQPSMRSTRVIFPT